MIEADLGRPFSRLPVIPLDLRPHKVSITIHCTVIVSMNCIVPLGLYFALKYTTSLPLRTIIPIITAVIGAPTLVLWVSRSWKLFRTEKLRPVGSSSRWAFDYFHWNLTTGIVYMAVVFAIASRVSSGLRLFSLMLPLIILQCCLQLVFLEWFFFLGLRAHFSFSSVKVASKFPPGVVLLAEDTCGVDGNLGRSFRFALHERVAASPSLERALRRLDWIWGLSGAILGFALIGMIFGIDNDEIGFTIGNNVPHSNQAIILTPLDSIHSPMGMGNDPDNIYHQICPSHFKRRELDLLSDNASR